MTVPCHNPDRQPHNIEPGERRLELTFTVDWGADDLRDSHEKTLVFCSFACLAGWAQQKGLQHDGVTVQEGTKER